MRHISSWILVGLMTFVGGVAHAQGGPPDGRGPACSPELRHRTTQEVLVSQRAALASGDWATVRCNYANDAVVITDGGVISGVDQIVGALQGFAGLFGESVPLVDEEIVVSILNDKAEMARIIFHIETPCVDIPDGTDTYIVKDGQIQAQTAHGFPVFKCGFPPAP